MSSSNSSTTPALPTPESLLLSASIFTSTVSSWIPANFGHVTPAAEAEKEWQSLLRAAGEGKDRLGLGHPLINAPKPPGGGYRGGLQGLEKSMKNGKRRLGEEEKERGNKEEKTQEVEEDEEESRASMVGKRKRVAVFDPLGGKRKKGGKQGAGTPTGTASAENSARASPAAEVTPAPVAAPPAKEEARSTPTPTITPAASTTPITQSPSKPIPQTSSNSQSAQSTSAPTSPVKSKSALKREKKKLAKQARLAAEQQAAAER